MPVQPKYDFGITISPKTEHSWICQKFLDDKIKSYSDRYVYVFEYGETGTHKHLHLFVQKRTPMRLFDFNKSIFKWLEKTIGVELKPAILETTEANNPAYWLEEYMTKESGYTLVGISQQEVEQIILHGKAIKKAVGLKALTAKKFRHIYEDVIRPTFPPDAFDDFGGEKDYFRGSRYFSCIQAIQKLGYDETKMITSRAAYIKVMDFVDANHNLELKVELLTAIRKELK